MKVHTSITVDVEVLVEARKRKFNISNEVNEFLKAKLEMEDKELPDDRFALKQEISVMKASLSEAEKKLKEKEKKVVIING